MKVRGKQGRPRETADAGSANCRRRTRAPLPLTLQVVVIGVLGHAAVQEGPGEVVHSVLLVLNGLGDDLGIEVVMHAVVQVRLHRQRLIQELLEEILWERTSMTLQYTVKDSTVTKAGQGQMWPLCNRHTRLIQNGSSQLHGQGELGVCARPTTSRLFPQCRKDTEPRRLSRA